MLASSPSFPAYQPTSYVMQIFLPQSHTRRIYANEFDLKWFSKIVKERESSFALTSKIDGVQLRDERVGIFKPTVPSRKCFPISFLSLLMKLESRMLRKRERNTDRKHYFHSFNLQARLDRLRSSSISALIRAELKPRPIQKVSKADFWVISDNEVVRGSLIHGRFFTPSLSAPSNPAMSCENKKPLSTLPEALEEDEDIENEALARRQKDNSATIGFSSSSASTCQVCSSKY